MDAKRVAIGTVVGGVTMFLVGSLIWNIGYWNAALDAAGVAREPQLLWANAPILPRSANGRIGVNILSHLSSGSSSGLRVYKGAFRGRRIGKAG